MPAATLAQPVPIETAHEDMIHDAQLDYYGKRLATCSSDRTVKIFDVIDGETQSKPGQVLKGHAGPVWQVAWAHPKFGSILASCSYDGKVLIWKEEAAAGWVKVKEHTLHSASVNSVSWAPHELGAILACASSDGKVSVLTFKNDGTWGADIFNSHAIGCNAVSWAPALYLPTTSQPSAHPGAPSVPPGSTQPVPRFASAGCDNLIKIWAYNPNSTSWLEQESLDGHTDWVRDVAWAPSVGGAEKATLASASQDRSVCIWNRDGPSAPWVKTYLDPSKALASPAVPAVPGNTSALPNKFPDVVWRVSWSLAGNLLAVSCGDGKVTLWKESLKGGWECVSDFDS